MIEEIKKEINQYLVKKHKNREDNLMIDLYDDIANILDQHKEQEDKYKKENIKTMKQLKKELEESSFTVELPLDSYSKYDAKVLEVDDILEILGELNIERNDK